MLRFILVLQLYVLCGMSQAQNSAMVMDSLENALHSMTDEKAKVKALNALSKFYCSSDLDKARSFNSTSIALAKKNNFSAGLANAYNIQGVIYINLGKSDLAIHSLNQSIEYCKKDNNLIGVAVGYGNIGILNYQKGNYADALAYQLKCLQINETLKNQIGIATSLLSISNIYFIQKNYTNARVYSYKALKIYTDLQDLEKKVTVLASLGLMATEENKMDEALTLLMTAKKISDSIGYENGIADCLNGIGTVYQKKGDLTQAQKLMEESISIFEKIGNRIKITEGIGDLAGIYLAQKNYSKAIEYNQKLLSEAKQMNSIQYERDALQGLAIAYSKTNDYKEAYFYETAARSLNDSILSNENLNRIVEMETKYETKQKEQENNLLKINLEKKQYFIYGTIAFALILIALVFLIARQDKLTVEQSLLKLEQKLLRSQMNPHFIFNSLQAIQNYILKNETKEAHKYLTSFAKLIRMVLENSRHEFIPLDKEIALLEYYLQLQKLRFAQRFEYTIDASEITDKKSMLLPPMLAQPFIENALEHGMRDIDSGGLILIKYIMEDNFLIFEITDNGKGIQNKENKAESHYSMATAITHERIQLLNKKKSPKTSFTIAEAFPNELVHKGVKVVFRIPI